jgi:hypothetical protein
VCAPRRARGSPSRCIQLLNRDDVPLALVSSLDAARGYQGLAPYPSENKELRLIARVPIGPAQNGQRLDRRGRTLSRLVSVAQKVAWLHANGAYRKHPVRGNGQSPPVICCDNST